MKNRTFLIAIWGVAILLILGGLLYLRSYQKTPQKPIVETKIDTQETEETQDKKSKPPLENLVQAWISLRRVFAPESLPPSYQPSFSEEDERQAKVAASILNRLINLDPDKNQEAIAKLLQDIKNIGYPAIKPILDMMQTMKSERPLSLLMMALKEIPDVEIAPHLKPLILSHSSKNIREQAIEIFISRATADQKEEFANEVKSRLSSNGAIRVDEKIRLIEALGALNHPQAFMLLSDITLNDINLKSRKAAIESIGNLSHPRKEDFLLDLLKNESLLRKAVAEALTKRPSDYISENIIEIIEETSDKSLKLTAIEILGGQNNERSKNYLLDLLINSEDQQVLRAAFTAAGQIKNGDMARSLLQILNTTDNPRQRRAIVRALTRMDEKAIPYLKEATQDYDPNIQREAINALARMKNPKAFDALKDIVVDWKKYDATAQQLMLTGLRNFKRTDVVGTVEQIALESDHPSVRRTAMETAVVINGQNELPFIMKVYAQDNADIVKRGALRLMQRYGDEDTADFLSRELREGNNPHLKSDIERAINFIEARKGK